ncbi:MAG: GNAT family protein [Anaerolineales bacterium]
MKIEDYQLSNESILIRPYQMNDARPCFDAILESMDELMPWMFWCHTDITYPEIEDWVKSRPGAWLDDISYEFAIIDSRQGSFIGNCGLVHVDLQNRKAELGYWMRTSQTRKGFATQASKLALKFAFDVLQLNRVEIIVETKNMASQKVAEKLGAKMEGLMRQRLHIHDTFRDAILYAVLAEENVSV